MLNTINEFEIVHLMLEIIILKQFLAETILLAKLRCLMQLIKVSFEYN